MARPLRVVMISSEVESFARTGGLGDMVAALARALAELGADVIVATPLYGVTRVPKSASWWPHPIHARVGWGQFDLRQLGVLEVPADGVERGRLRFCLLADTHLFGR